MQLYAIINRGWETSRPRGGMSDILCLYLSKASFVSVSVLPSGSGKQLASIGLPDHTL